MQPVDIGTINQRSSGSICVPEVLFSKTRSQPGAGHARLGISSSVTMTLEM